MTGSTAQELLDRFTYKPGWKFTMISDFDVYAWMLAVDFPAPDACKMDGSWTYVHSVHAFPVVALDVDHFWTWLRSVIQSIEFHEIEEFFQVDGAAIWWPHT